MSSPVSYEVEGRVGVVTVDYPPVNALGPGVREGIRDCIERGNADDAVDAMVLIGAGRSFIAGADIKQLGQAPLPGKRPQDVLDDSAKPVIAAIHGFALGGGLEIALACHYRIATPDAKVGLPEVLIGIVPGGGGTQRLPRLVGAAAALDWIVSGRHVPAPQAQAAGVVDRIVDGDDLRAAATAFAAEVAAERPLPRVRDRAVPDAAGAPAAAEAIRKRIARRARNQRAPYACIEAVEASVAVPFDEGVARERELFESLVDSDEAKALRYAFFAERRARDVPGVPEGTRGRDVSRAAVIGGGTMGTGIAMTLADAGIEVDLLEASLEAQRAAMHRISDTYAVSVKRGSLGESDMTERLARIHAAPGYDALADADIVIEAVFEDMTVKRDVFKKMDAAAKAGAILATNTSALDVDAIAAATRRPESVVGTHFFSPANVMKLLEIVRGKQTDPEVLASVLALAKRTGKVGVVTGNCDGFTANRSRAPFTTEMNVLVEEGASPVDVDRVMVEFGYPMGPFVVADLAGGDIGYAGRKRREAKSNDARVLPIADRLVEMGRHGMKTGAGWYRYEEGDRTPHPDPVVDRVIDEVRAELGVEPREFTDEEILHRILFASVNEACKILAEGIAYRPSDIDAMWLNGFGFPRYRGGLMHWADGIGVARIVETMRGWAKSIGPRWKPAALLSDLAKSNRSFADL